MDITNRTTLSKWTYRISLSLMILVTVRGGRLMWDQTEHLAGGAQGTMLLLAQFSVMTTPLALLICCLAMALRSGAVIWLLGLQFGVTVVPILITTWDNRAIFAVTLGVVVGILGLLAAILTFLVSKQELRAP